MTTKAKPKVATTQRVRIYYGGITTIYASTEVARRVRDHCVRLESVLAPKKGENDLVVGILCGAADEMPDHIMAGGRNLLLHGRTPKAWMKEQRLSAADEQLLYRQGDY